MADYTVAGQGAKGAARGTILGAVGGFFAGALGGAASLLVSFGVPAAAVGAVGGLAVGIFTGGIGAAIGMGILYAAGAVAVGGAVMGAAAGTAIGTGAGLGFGLFTGMSKGAEKVKNRSFVRDQEIQAAIARGVDEKLEYYTAATYKQGAEEMKAYIGNQLMAAQKQMQQQAALEMAQANEKPEKKFTDACCAKKPHASHAEAVLEGKALAAQQTPGVV